MFCGNCGCEITENDVFCPNCGSKVEESGTPNKVYYGNIPIKQQTVSHNMEQEEDIAVPGIIKTPVTVGEKEESVLIYVLMGTALVLLIAAICVGLFYLYKLNDTDTDTYQIPQVSSAAADTDTDTATADSQQIVIEDSQSDTVAVTPQATSTLIATPMVTATAAPVPSTSYGEYIFPNSSNSYLSRSDITALSGYDMYLARNEIYARHGRKFTNADLQQYFSAKSWYTPVYEPEDFDAMQETIFNDYEKENIKLIRSIEDEFGYHY